MTNPLLANSTLPPFSQIQAEQVVPAIESLLAQCRSTLARVIANNSTGPVTWESLIEPLEEQDDRLSKAWSPVGHLNSVLNSDELREAYTKSLSLLTAYGTEVGQNSELYQAYQKLADSSDFQRLNQAQKTSVEHALRDFKLAGVALPQAQKRVYAELRQQLSELSTQFSNNVLDATQGWFKQVETEADLAGIPDNAKALARQAAEQKQLKGWVFTLDLPSYLAVMTHSSHRPLREEMYRAYASRASEAGLSSTDADPKAWDNTNIINELLAKRHQLSQLLGFNHYAERSLATKMAESCDQVEDFLIQLAQKSKPAAEQEFRDLCAFAKALDGNDDMQAWDVGYYSEKMRVAKYAISQEELRPYFPAQKVVDGMFAVVEKLFDVQIKAATAQLWHEDVHFYCIEKNGQAIASFYLDLYARDKKRGGAWMDVCRTRRLSDAELQLPVAYLTCNFPPAVGDKPALLTHDEVVTLFHEFGHGLHHMLTQQTVASVSGISGVAWDAVELPSQFLENWCWQGTVIEMLSGHFETGESLPKPLLDNLLAAKNFQSAMQMLRQIEFSLFDFRLHRNYLSENPQPVQQVLDQIREEVAVVIPPSFNRFQNSFGHIFAGGYAAGYYSYKWAEVLSSDAFSAFEEDGIFDPETGAKFLSEILQKGGSQDAMTLFKNFRGREPNIDALLRHSGINK